MILSISKKGRKILVHAKFDKRILHQRRLRFYSVDAKEAAQKEFPNLDLEILPEDLSLTIDNYSELNEGNWTFIVNKKNDLSVKEKKEEINDL